MGCTLNYTEKDHEQALGLVEKDPQQPAKTKKQRREEIRTSLKRASSTVLIPILSNPNHKAYSAVTELLFKAVGSREHLSAAEQEKFPGAFCIVLKYYPKAMGVFEAGPSHWGPGTTPISHPYEVLATAALIQHSFQSKNGKTFSISPGSDKVDFGIKFAHGYAQPRRSGTIEADILVYKGGMDPKTIAIDAKHAEDGKFGIPDKNEFHRQLEGIRNGFRDDKFHDFCFVTNGIFSDKFKEMVQKENLQIALDFAKEKNYLYHDEKRGFGTRDLTKEERASIPPEKIPESFFREYNQDVEKFINDYPIRQIELCEHVKLPGT